MGEHYQSHSQRLKGDRQSFGFSRENITSNNLIIPVAYYLKHIGLPDNFESSSAAAGNRIAIKSGLPGPCSSGVQLHADGVLKPIRDIIRKSHDGAFPLQQITDRFKGHQPFLELYRGRYTAIFSIRKYGQGDTTSCDGCAVSLGGHAQPLSYRPYVPQIGIYV
jgi:hypothetical protein